MELYVLITTDKRLTVEEMEAALQAAFPYVEINVRVEE